MQRINLSSIRQVIYPVHAPYARIGGDPDLYISAVGKFSSAGKFEYEQIAGQISLHCILEGAGIMNADGRAYQVGAGDIFTFFPGFHVHYYDTKDAPWSYIWFSLSGARATWALSCCGITAGAPLCKAPVEPEYDRFLDRILKIYKRGRYTPAQPAVLGWQLMDLLMRNHAKFAKTAFSPDIAAACKHRISSDFTSGLTIHKLAMDLKVNRSTLFRVFQRAYGVSPKEYLDQQRLIKAVDLLKGTDVSVKQAAILSGFKDQGYFSRVFSKKYSMPPGQWRSQLRENS